MLQAVQKLWAKLKKDVMRFVFLFFKFLFSQNVCACMQSTCACRVSLMLNFSVWARLGCGTSANIYINLFCVTVGFENRKVRSPSVL